MMTKYYRLILILLLIGSLGACRKVKYQKDVHDYYPKVQTDSVKILPDGSVQVTAKVTSPGSGELYFIGFCLDTVPNPEMDINQQLVHEMTDDVFTTTYKKLDAQKNYYVRSFAANEFGYSYGNDLMITHPGPDTNTIPCHPGANTIMIESSSSTRLDDIYSVGKLDPITHRVEFSSLNYSYALRLEFGRTPTSGKYTIWENPGNGSDIVSISFSDPNQGTYYMANGGELYVEQVDATRIRVWICHQKSGEGRFITTNFTSE